MLYAKVVLGLPVEGPFDYLVAVELEKKILAGTRVWVNFCNRKTVGYVVGLSSESAIKNCKEITALIDTAAVINKNTLELAEKISAYYCCSLGEAIETMLPEGLRKGRAIQIPPFPPFSKGGDLCEPPFFLKGGRGRFKTEETFFLLGQNRMPAYCEEIKQSLLLKRSVILLFSDIAAVKEAQELIAQELKCEVFVSFRKQPDELSVWQKIRENACCVVVGTRSAVFAPVNNLGLIIIDRQEDSVYKQEQVPHYHARQVALMRCAIEGARLIWGNSNLFIEGFYLAHKNNCKIIQLTAEKKYPEVKIVDTRRLSFADRKTKPIFSKFLLDAIGNVLNQNQIPPNPPFSKGGDSYQLPFFSKGGTGGFKGKVLLFLNRLGFATQAACNDCGANLKCPRCNISLVYHFDKGTLNCHHCVFKMPVPKVCPQCNSGYIKFSGLGTEKIESELSRIFPQARIKNAGEKTGLKNADIFISTSAILKREEYSFDLIGVIGIDSSLNRLDWAAAEKSFGILKGLSGLADKQLIVQTTNPTHHVFEALAKNDPDVFYASELKFRKQLGYPPFRHMILIKLRGADLEKVKKAGLDLFAKFQSGKPPTLKVISLNPGVYEKLRGNFHYQILCSVADVGKASKFIKSRLKNARYSGIIVTVDVDPV